MDPQKEKLFVCHIKRNLCEVISYLGKPKIKNMREEMKVTNTVPFT